MLYIHSCTYIYIYTHTVMCTTHIKLWCCTSASVKKEMGGGGGGEKIMVLYISISKKRNGGGGGEKSKKKRMANSMHTTYKVTINTQTFLNVHVFLINPPS